mgnify:CR=1 FL=1
MHINHWLGWGVFLSHSRISHSFGGLGWWCIEIITAIIIIGQQKVIHCHAFSAFQQLSKISVLCFKWCWRRKTDGMFPVITYYISSNKIIRLSSSSPVRCRTSNKYAVIIQRADLKWIYITKTRMVFFLLLNSSSVRDKTWNNDTYMKMIYGNKKICSLLRQKGNIKHKLSLPVFNHFRIRETINIEKYSVEHFALSETITTRNIERNMENRQLWKKKKKTCSFPYLSISLWTTVTACGHTIWFRYPWFQSFIIFIN